MSVPLRRRWKRWKQHPVQRVALPAVIALLLVWGVFAFFSEHLRPMVETVAKSQATNLISVTVSQVVEQCMSQQGLSYNDLMEMHQQEENGTITVTGRTTVIQQLRNDITQALVEQLENLDSGQLGVPLGNLTGWMLFSGLGPKLRVTIDSVGDVVTQVYNQFDSAGINQTHHQVLMDVSVTVHLFIPGEITSVTVDTTVCLAETIFLGTVPNSYLQTG
ncbi:sporulation protein YunB [Pseudoflavonifractor sp. An85]|uniref:sporulation protein YunB n=1 Tax=Pseudoflavonifractor sp. An85 TaxID=1965661 RepID=UPI0013025026|nr:sporulation protein YunB [Pseudoflavonifractor sp. An85]